MQSFLTKLLRDVRKVRTARPARRSPRRANLHLERLDERINLSSASLTGSTLQITADPGIIGVVLKGHVIPPSVRQINFEADAQKPGELDVFDGTTSLGQFPIASIKNVDVSLAYLDAVNVDDSNGLPFAHGATISLSAGSRIDNSLNLTGNRTVSGSEVYTVGATAAQGSSLLQDGLRFNLNNTIGSVTDLVKSTEGSLTVSTEDQNVSLTGSNGVTQTLSGLGQGGGGSFTYSNQETVALNEFAANADVVLNATAGATGEKSFMLQMEAGGENDQAYIQATPHTVTTTVTAEGTAEFVYLQSNSGPVSVLGNSSTNVNLGEAASDGLDTTAGINANVSVNSVESLLLADSGNTTTEENVTLTESTISGTGLFGTNAVKITYTNTASVAFLTGQLQDTYKVKGSVDAASFSSFITIDDFSTKGLTVQATVDANTDLSLSLTNSVDMPNAFLTITALDGGIFSSPNPRLRQGTEFVGYGDVNASQVNYDNFGVTLN